MREMPAVLQLACWITGSLILGLALCFPFFSYLPLMWGVGLAVVILLYFAGSVVFRRDPFPSDYFVVSLIFTGLFGGAVATFTGIERVEHYECAWKLVDSGIHVDLSPIHGFGWSRVESTELVDHLQKNPSKVWVEVPVVRDFGHVRARGMIHRIDGISVREVDQTSPPLTLPADPPVTGSGI